MGLSLVIVQVMSIQKCPTARKSMQSKLWQWAQFLTMRLSRDGFERWCFDLDISLSLQWNKNRGWSFSLEPDRWFRSPVNRNSTRRSRPRVDCCYNWSLMIGSQGSRIGRKCSGASRLRAVPEFVSKIIKSPVVLCERKIFRAIWLPDRVFSEVFDNCLGK